MSVAAVGALAIALELTWSTPTAAQSPGAAHERSATPERSVTDTQSATAGAAAADEAADHNAASGGAAGDRAADDLETGAGDRGLAVSRHQVRIDGETIGYRATAGRVPVENNDGRRALIFFVAYEREDSEREDSEREDGERGDGERASRPITFVFNGGPGAAAAYLHLGALGPRRVVLGDDGSIPPPPARLTANAESWLRFTDLVFVDPVGTGYSRLAPADDDDGEAAGGSSSRAPFWETRSDLRALAEFIRLHLSREQRRLSPVFLAGESYGGFRAAALAERLTADTGIGLNGVVLISPVLEFSLLYGDAYRLLPWALLLPSYAATAVEHGRARLVAGDPLSVGGRSPALDEVEAFATGSFLSTLAEGDGADPGVAAELYRRISAYTGLPEDLVARHRGRVPRGVFAKQLPGEAGRVVSLYDGAIVGVDARPQDPERGGRDPVLDGLTAPLTSALVAYVGEDLGYETDLRYELLNIDVNRAWRWRGRSQRQGYLGAADDLKKAMSLNTDLRVLVTHGYFDLVTPYFGSRYVVDQMALDPSIRENLILKTYRGGHMFYTHATTREQFYRDARAFYRAAVDPSTGPAGSSAPDPAGRERVDRPADASAATGARSPKDGNGSAQGAAQGSGPLP